MRARFPGISNENIVKLKSLLLGQRSVVLDPHEKKTFAKIHHDVCLYELKHFMVQTSKLCLELEEKDPTFKDKCSVFVSVASDEAPDYQKDIMATYALLKFLTDY